MPARPRRNPHRVPPLHRAAAAAATAGLVLGTAGLATGAAHAAGTAPTADAATAAAPVEEAAAQPQVQLGSDRIAAGGTVSFAVTGYPADARLTVKLDKRTVLGTFTVNSVGTAAGRLTLPADTAEGAHRFNFLAPGTAVHPGFTVSADPAPETAKVLTAAASAAAGGRLPFAVTGYPAGAGLTVKLKAADGSSVQLDPVLAVGDDGTYAGAVTVPAQTAAADYRLFFLAPGTNPSAPLTVTAPSDGGNHDPGDAETAAPTAVLAAAEAPAGGKLGFTVANFPAGGTLTVKMGTGTGDDAKADAAVLQQFEGAIGEDGTHSGELTLPADATAGEHTLFFLAPGGHSARAALTVTAAAPGNGGSTDGETPGGDAPSGEPAVAVTASEVAAGGKLGFTVANFPADGTLTVKLDDGEILDTFTVGNDGAVSDEVTVPADTAAGAHWLRFLAKPGYTYKADFTVTADSADSAAGGPDTAGTGSATGGTGTTASTGSTGIPATGGSLTTTASTATTGGALASTGASGVTLPLAGAGALVVLGGAAVAVARRRTGDAPDA
ncbi:hypothetical protein [Streptomyces sp. HB2AG]|uniref:hypothetical protein n=1 Tax=Streptomyces sp. HB2AG TaxID=2983400 RepID=UPI0022AA87AD|nr:hypothetical protein [Streptomyces sp. HB2AG]MCZ2527163.1 hypothetical protein [Streptomyces sp. HB2AG]